MEQAAAPAAAAAPPVDIFKLVADKVLEQDQERDAVAGVESELLFVGAKNSGKSTLIHSFLSKEEAPKPTSALEYRFARRSTGEDKAVANIWELGGGSQLRCAGCCRIPLCCSCTARLAPIDPTRPLCPQPSRPAAQPCARAAACSDLLKVVLLPDRLTSCVLAITLDLSNPGAHAGQGEGEGEGEGAGAGAG